MVSRSRTKSDDENWRVEMREGSGWVRDGRVEFGELAPEGSLGVFGGGIFSRLELRGDHEGDGENWSKSPLKTRQARDILAPDDSILELFAAHGVAAVSDSLAGGDGLVGRAARCSGSTAGSSRNRGTSA